MKKQKVNYKEGSMMDDWIFESSGEVFKLSPKTPLLFQENQEWIKASVEEFQPSCWRVRLKESKQVKELKYHKTSIRINSSYIEYVGKLKTFCELLAIHENVNVVINMLSKKVS